MDEEIFLKLQIDNTSKYYKSCSNLQFDQRISAKKWKIIIEKMLN